VGVPRLRAICSRLASLMSLSCFQKSSCFWTALLADRSVWALSRRSIAHALEDTLHTTSCSCCSS